MVSQRLTPWSKLPRQPPRAVYSIKRFAGELDISERTLWRLIRAGKVKTVALSVGRTGIPGSELERIATRGIEQ